MRVPGKVWHSVEKAILLHNITVPFTNVCKNIYTINIYKYRPFAYITKDITVN